ncbi:MAG TPA: hypothetical protein VGF99_00885 [Myxococcota bacterium]
MPAVFLTNEMLQQWSDDGKVRLDDTTLTLIKEDRTVKLSPAVRFTKLIDGGVDPNKLIGKVKTTAQLGELGAEHYLDSVIFGDVGYTVVEGFLGDLSPAARKPTASAAPAPADDFHERTDVHVVSSLKSQLAGASASTTSSSMPAFNPNAAPAAVDLPPAPRTPSSSTQPVKTLSEAEALSQLFLSTVRDK